MNITPERITELKPKEVFCFGSNEKGRHGLGAAKLAYNEFGAVWGKGFGLFGQSFAIPTKDENIETLPLDKIQTYIQAFEVQVINHPTLIFYVTQIGCGYAGYTPKDIAPLFKSCYQLPNVYMPESFWEIYKKVNHEL